MEQQVSQMNAGRLRPDTILAIGSMALLATGALFISVLYPLVGKFVPPCPFLWSTGCYCPGCGATRMFRSIASGDLGAAFGHNPLLMLSLPVFGYLYLSFLSGEFLGRAFPKPTGLRAYTWVAPVIVLGFWIVRNLPWEPLTYLAP